jgi:Bardet-Biedl syndrome 7 protein
MVQDGKAFTLDKCDLVKVATTSHRGTLALLPVGKKGRQKFVVGDDAGDVRAYEMKRGEAQLIFAYSELGGPVTALTVGGGVGGKQDKVFATQGSRIVGLNKKGKEFFKLTSTLSETMHHLEVDSACIFTGCEYIYNLYDDGRVSQ